MQIIALLLQSYSRSISIKVIEALEELIVNNLIKGYKEFDNPTNRDIVRMLTVEGTVDINRKLILPCNLTTLIDKVKDILKSFLKRVAKNRAIELLSRVLFPFSNYGFSDYSLGNSFNNLT